MHNDNLIEEIDKRNDKAIKGYTTADREGYNFKEFVSDTIKMSEEINYENGVCGAQMALAARYIIFGEYDKSLEIIYKVESKIKIQDLNIRNRMNYYSVYVLYYVNCTGNFNKAIEYAKKEMEVADELGDIYEVMRIKHNIGAINGELGFYETSLQFLTEAREYFESTQKYSLLAHCYLNLGESYYGINEVDKAQDYYEKAHDVAVKENEIAVINDALLGWVKINRDLKDYEKALDLLNNAMNHINGINNLQAELEVINELVSTYIMIGDNPKALAIIEEFENKALQVENIQDKMVYYKYKYEVCEDLGQFEKAYEAMTIYHGLYERNNYKESEHAMNELIQVEYSKAVRRLETIASVGRELTVLTDLDQVLLNVKSELSKILSINNIAIGIINGNQIEFNHHFVNEEKAVSKSLKLDNELSLAVHCGNNKKVIIINDLDKEYSQYVKGITKVRLGKDTDNNVKVRSVMYAPLMIDEEVMGVFSIQSYKKNAYTSVETKIYRIITDYIAIAINNVKKNETLKYMSIRDDLTNLYNRRGFTEFFDNQVLLKEDQVSTVSIIMLDIDSFKRINEQYGHATGDQVLCALGEKLKEKEEHNVIAARLGGEEFGLIAINKDLEFIRNYAEEIRQSIEDLEIMINGYKIKIHTSVGVAFKYNGDEVTYNQLYFEADNALCRAKELGQNQVQVNR